MRLTITLMAIFGCLHLSSLSAAVGDTDLQIITNNIRQLLLGSTASGPPQNGAAEKYLQSMRPDGSWADEDYRDTDRQHWKAIDHLPRLEKILKAYYSPNGSLAGRPDVLDRCVVSLKFWLDQDPHNVNWWHNEIGVPAQVGEILILLGDTAPADLKQRGTELMKRANWEKQTGANLTDETRIQVMRGCISTSIDLISQAYDRTWQEVRLAGAGEDGMQADHSFHQHGPLIYCKGYGTVFVDDIIEFVNYARGTSIQMPADKQELFDAYLMGGPDWMLRGGNWDFGVCGRGIVRPNTLNGSMLNEIRPMAEFEGSLQKDLESATKRLNEKDDASAPTGNRQYWLSDYMVHRRANYFTSVRMYSSRTLNTDQLTNGENRKSHHIADGATCLMTSGGEYFNIFPIWDWMKIPGTTAEQTPPLDPAVVSHKAKSPFVGEVSDGTFGCAAMDLQSDQLHADKAWFCFDNEMVCLGSDISCTSANPVMTTVNQCLLRGPVNLSNESSVPAHVDRDLNDAQCVWHDSIGYIFPTAEHVHLKTGTQTGSWSQIGVGSDKKITGDVFSLWIDHGSEAAHAKYQYIVLPGSDFAHTQSEAQNLPVKIVDNSPGLQAVWHTQLHLLEAVFHQPDDLKIDQMQVSVDKPCLLLVKRDGTKIELAASNPLNAPLAVNVSVTIDGHGNRMLLDLPGGLMAGKSVVREITAGD